MIIEKFHEKSFITRIVNDTVWKDLSKDTFIYSELLLWWYPTGQIGLWSFYQQVIWGLGHMRIHRVNMSQYVGTQSLEDHQIKPQLIFLEYVSVIQWPTVVIISKFYYYTSWVKKRSFNNKGLTLRSHEAETLEKSLFSDSLN